MQMRDVDGNMHNLDGTWQEGDEVIYRLERVGVDQYSHYMPSEKRASIAADGTIETVSLWASQGGGRNILVILPNGAAFRVAVPPGEDVISLETLHLLYSQPEPAVSAAVQTLIEEATAEAVAFETAALIAADEAEAATRASADTTLQENITAEATARGSADATLQAAVTAEATARTTADATLTADLATHTGNTTNPHAVTSFQVLGTIAPRIYTTMPTQAALQTDLNADSAANIRRVYYLPRATLAITGDLTLSAGQTVLGMGDDFDQLGTVLSLAATGRIVLKKQATIEHVHIVQSASASVDAVYAVGSPSDSNAHYLRLRNIQFSGGNAATWCIHLQNPYEFFFQNIKANTSSNGIFIEATNDHPYNPGDASAYDIKIRTRAANTVGLRIYGQKAVDTVGHYGGTNRYPNDIRFYSFYVSGADNAAWLTSNMNGIEIVNCPKVYFDNVNIEENTVGISLSGGVNSGANTTARFSGWCADAIVVGSGVSEALFNGVQLDSTPTGAGTGAVTIVGRDVGTGTSMSMVLSPHFRGALGAKTLSLEVHATNGSGSTINLNRIVAWDTSGNVQLMTSTDSISKFAGITQNNADASATALITNVGIVTVSTTGAVAIGDYLTIDASNPGRVTSLGASLSAGQKALGYAVTSTGSAGNILMRIAPQYAPPVPASSNGPGFAKSTLYYASGLTWTTAAMTLNAMTAAPIWVPRSTTFDQIGVEITTNVATALVRLGIYADDGNGYPGALVLDAGTVDAAASTGFKTITISQLLATGLYWLVSVAQTAAPSARVISTPSYAIGYSGTPGAGVHAGYLHGSVSGALPASFTVTPSSTGGIPRVSLRVV